MAGEFCCDSEQRRDDYFLVLSAIAADQKSTGAHTMYIQYEPNLSAFVWLAATTAVKTTAVKKKKTRICDFFFRLLVPNAEP